MRRIIATITLVLISVVANAQSTYDPFRDSSFMHDFIQICGILSAVFLISSFLLTFVKLILDHRIKNRMIERGVGENVVSQLLQPGKKETANAAVKWFVIFAGIGLGLTLIDLFQPIGIHSLAIMSFCIAAGFLGYYYFTKKTDKQ